MKASHHILTLLGAIMAVLGASVMGWASLVGVPDVLVPGYALAPAGQVALGLSLLTALLVLGRLVTGRAGLAGAITMTSIALLVWTGTAYGLAQAGPSSFVPGAGMIVALLGATLASASALWSQRDARLRVCVEVTCDGRLLETKTLSKAGTWRPVIDWSIGTRGLDARPAAFHLASAGEVVLGVHARDARQTRLRGTVLSPERWMGDAANAVRAIELHPGDWGVCTSGPVETRFEVRGARLQSGTDALAVAAVAAALFLQVGLMGLATQPWVPEDLELRLPTQSVLLDERPIRPAPPAVPLLLSAPEAAQPSGADAARLTGLIGGHTSRAARPGDGHPRERRASQPAAVRSPARSVAVGLTDLLTSPQPGSPVAEVLRRDGASEERIGRLFDDQTVVRRPAALAYVGSKAAMAEPSGSIAASPDSKTPTRLSAPKTVRRVQQAAAPVMRSWARSKDSECKHLSQALRRRAASFQACYLARSVARPTLRGRITLGFSLAVQGRLKEVTVTGNSLADRALTQCLLRRMRQMRVRSVDQACRGSFTFHFGR